MPQLVKSLLFGLELHIKKDLFTAGGVASIYYNKMPNPSEVWIVSIPFMII